MFGNYFKENREFIYSLILMIMIPLLIVVNTLWQNRVSSKTSTNEVQSKALLSEAVLVNSIDITKNTPDEIGNQLQRIVRENKDINEITVLTPSASGFSVLASTNEQNLGLTLTSEDYVKAYTSNNPIINIIKKSNDRLLTISSSIQDSITGKKVALLNFQISLTTVDDANNKMRSNSLVILVVTIFLVLLLLINNIRFFEYAVLFKKLNEVDKMKDDFISIASHEMKTPMAAIKGYISMMMEGLVGKFDKQTLDHLQKINVNIQRLDLLLSETLDVSRLEQGRMQFDMVPVNISSIIEQTIKMSLDQANSKGLTLSEERPPYQTVVFADPDRLQQVADNLIGNAIKYTAKGGVTISYEIKDGKLLTKIKDTGIGMNEPDRKNLFSKFYRIKNEKTVDIPGTGLGLWIAREIIRKMNGDIIVESTENVGSVFTIVMPYIKEE